MNMQALPVDGPTPIEALEASVKGSSFYNAMRIMPAPRRHGMFAIYAFCREVDDIADGEDAPDLKRAQLAQWHAEIDRIYARSPQSALGRALLGPIDQFNLRREDFIAVIDGMAMDAEADIVAPDMKTLDLYCDRVASAVGRLSVRIFGASGVQADDVAYHLGRALQLSNILRDIAEDAARGRLYLPSDLLDVHGITTREIGEIITHPNLFLVGQDLAQVALDHFAKAAIAMDRCPRGPMRTARLMGAAYRLILDKVLARGFKDLDTPIKISRWTKLWILLRYGLI